MDKKELSKLGWRVTGIAHIPMNDDCRKGEMVVEYLDKVDYKITKKPEPWNGEGLPPVGTECEAKKSETWVRGTVVHHAESGSVLFVDEDEILAFWSKEFRPIRTEEEKLIEQAYNAMSDEPLQGNEMDDKDLLSYAEALIDAGWRPNNQ